MDESQILASLNASLSGLGRATPQSIRGRTTLMIGHPYSQLACYKQWADRGLYDVVGQNLDRLNAQDAAIMLRILDHIHVVDKVFQHHLRGLPHDFRAPRSEELPDFQALANSVREIDGWYASYVDKLPESDFDESVDFAFTNGTPARMRRGEIILHVCLHGTYHRGNAGIVLQKNGIAANNDRMTDFLEATV
jgi:uncharacterized damage-inducible protein DinB